MDLSRPILRSARAGAVRQTLKGTTEGVLPREESSVISYKRHRYHADVIRYPQPIFVRKGNRVSSASPADWPSTLGGSCQARSLAARERRSRPSIRSAADQVIVS